MKKNILYCISGFAAGIINGLLGAAGGMILVPMMNKIGIKAKKSHANSVIVILIISIFSAVLYLSRNFVKIEDVYPYILFGVIGSLIGAVLLTKIKDLWIKKIFALLMIWAAVRLLIK
ncbi:MAG: sulfite exporter TauE/SafE family protein [Clostridia bacterium]|nr:sulfite exporter TauE/SafE family protein [Clostridia bacterium]